ncbi:MAG: hypothetical protein O3A00_07925 [Planctomycetota bacterium]|nr:hypothetical protein [Planctomycetota bacterium]
MKKTICLTVLVCSLGVSMMLTARGDATKESGIDIADLAADAKAKVGLIGDMLATGESFEESIKEKKLAQAAGTLAALSQGITEHPQGKGTGIAGPALRDAAAALAKTKSLDEATKLLAGAQAALEGKGDGDVKADWAKLVNMHRSMDEVQSRFNQIRRLRRKPTTPNEDSIHASTLAILAKTIQADTHEVKNKADLPEWKTFADSLSDSSRGLAKAMKAEDKAGITKFYLAATKACAGCHAKFRD